MNVVTIFCFVLISSCNLLVFYFAVDVTTHTCLFIWSIKRSYISTCFKLDWFYLNSFSCHKVLKINVPNLHREKPIMVISLCSHMVQLAYILINVLT